MMRDAASERQVQAADPAGSTWLSANAGSGKTRVLTDRVARLLLGGTEPQRVLCLTYTKAAASEMQNRLFKRLGSWAMLDEARLRRALAELGVEGTIGDDTLAQARRLFARAIETPGGLRIQTIHSFCASLLRRFPLEAGVSPQFTEMEDRAGRLMRAEIVEDLAAGEASCEVAGLARICSGEDFDDLLAEIARAGPRLARNVTWDEVLARFGLSAGTTAEGLVRNILLGGEDALFSGLDAPLRAGKASDVKLADQIAALRELPPTLDTLARMEAIFLTKGGAASPFSAKIGSLPTKDTRAALGSMLGPLEQLMARVEAGRQARVALAAAQRTFALHQFAGRFLPVYDARKAARGMLDFDDLIARAGALLTDPSVAQWVLFRLDGGIDHILVDEAQDTSPDQWRVIEQLAQEFTAGEGARDVARTIFVVGDKKQSIYSFQGADLQAFDAMKLHFRKRLAEAETHLADLTLEYSFRSSPAILRLVDLTFDLDAGRILGGEVKHIAFRDALPGRVDLWPAIAPTKAPEPDHWYDPTDLISEEHHAAQLARKIATEIAGLIARREQIHSHDGVRPIDAGDFLILVQRRSTLFNEIIRACKVAGLPIAGADRLKLGGELAVKDLTALLCFLATPEDDLSLAAALRSPLFGWSEDALFRLAQGRSGYLWRALRDAAGHDATLEMLRDLRDQADYLRPYDLLARILIRHQGRTRLLARLGDEAEDGIDALLAQALAYEKSEVPSLTGFVGWLQADEVDVKRQMDAAGGRIRVMTVHGAKGLEAPIVILPETQNRKPPEGGDIVTLAGGDPAWRMPADESPPDLVAAVARNREKAAEESLRLLYVALTRAQSWLIVAAAGETTQDNCWYNIVRDGMERAGAGALPDGRLRLAHAAWPEPAAQIDRRDTARPVLPDWALRPAPAAPREAAVLSPSDLGGPKALPGDTDATMQDDAMRRGSELHLLLEHLPGARSSAWPALAAQLLPGDPGLAVLRLAEARAVLEAPGLDAVFGPEGLNEAGITGEIGGRRFVGSIDRLIVNPAHILAIDYKSNRLIPDRPEAVPEGILRQMGAYAALLAQIYPGRRIETAILWTGAPALMPLPGALVMAALQRAGFP